MTMTYKHEYSEYTNITNYSPLKKKARMDMISTKVQEETKHRNYSTGAKMSVKLGKTVLLEEVGSDSEEDDFSVDSFHFKPKPFKSKVRKYDESENFVKFGSIRIEGISSAEFYEQKRLLYEIEDYSEINVAKKNLYEKISNSHVLTLKEDQDNHNYEIHMEGEDNSINKPQPQIKPQSEIKPPFQPDQAQAFSKVMLQLEEGLIENSGSSGKQGNSYIHKNWLRDIKVSLSNFLHKMISKN